MLTDLTSICFQELQFNRFNLTSSKGVKAMDTSAYLQTKVLSDLDAILFLVTSKLRHVSDGREKSF